MSGHILITTFPSEEYRHIANLPQLIALCPAASRLDECFAVYQVPDYIVPPHNSEGPRGPRMQEFTKTSAELLYLFLIRVMVGSAGTVMLIKTRKRRNVKI